jgi:hypothetical protein
MRDTAIVGHVNFAINPAALLPALWQGVLYRTTTAGSRTRTCDPLIKGQLLWTDLLLDG